MTIGRSSIVVLRHLPAMHPRFAVLHELSALHTWFSAPDGIVHLLVLPHLRPASQASSSSMSIAWQQSWSALPHLRKTSAYGLLLDVQLLRMPMRPPSALS